MNGYWRRHGALDELKKAGSRADINGGLDCGRSPDIQR